MAKPRCESGVVSCDPAPHVVSRPCVFRHQTQSVYWHEVEKQSKGKHTEHNGSATIREPDWRAMSRRESGLAKQWPNLLMKRIFATAYAESLKG